MLFSLEINSTTEMIEHRTHIHVLQRNVRQRTGLSQSSTLVPINCGHTQPFATVDGGLSYSYFHLFYCVSLLILQQM